MVENEKVLFVFRLKPLLQSFKTTFALQYLLVWLQSGKVLCLLSFVL